ncbi:raffinose/stachyose/melibiose transport system permease protein [Kineococcus xinjiangensis]|uniref:Raffinose/stachyose/melibiose transport system permease protein n=1 Tax=Kineococcus xinjiangensis TaxID=512762 RepID=A0A2S6IWZ4_9ACTN|nr:carbohydrate ABC transporter permease [Kineococcus xinjiangensis]PPK98853.1 raffinose/stachyose/melibiose transport system permease protein [Kineococcus xinjiangensis]
MSAVLAPERSVRPVPPPAPVRRSRGFLRRLPVRALIAVILVIEVYPLVWLLLSSFKTRREFVEEPFWSLPSSLAWGNYAEAWTTGNIGLYLRNSVLAVAPSLALIIVLGVAAGFALEVLVWKGRGTVLLIFLAGIMVPGQMILLPLFSAYFQLGLTGSLWPLIITYTATGLPLTVFMMATYFRAIPREVFEAAAIDGATVLRAFVSIGFPMVRNAVFTVALVQFFFIWNDLLIALTFTNSTELRTVQVGLLNFNGQFGATDYGPLFAAICMNVFGLLAIYLVLNKRIMAGLAGGAVKG